MTSGKQNATQTFRNVAEKKAYFKKYREDTEKMMRSNRPVPKGRNFVFWEHHEEKDTTDAYRENFDSIRWDRMPPANGI